MVSETKRIRLDTHGVLEETGETVHVTVELKIEITGILVRRA